MIKWIILLLSGVTSLRSFSQQPYWQQQVNYSIDVMLDDASNALDAFMKLEYVNHSPDTLNFIWFHIWPNAYKNDRTAFSEQLLELGRTDFYFSSKEQKGYINRLDFRANNERLKTQDHPAFIDVIKVLLNDPLLPGNSIQISTPFHVQLPYNFSRGGHNGQSYQVTQWYPKPAVYDKQGWHIMPYLEQGEYFSEFGDYQVQITVPENYVVAATGMLQDETEKKWLKAKSSTGNIRLEVEGAKQQKKPAIQKTKTTADEFPPSSKRLKTIHFTQQQITDFAWFADKRYLLQLDTIRLVSGRTILAGTYYTSGQEKYWKQSMGFIKDAIHFQSLQLGEYPFDVVSVVEARMGFEGGMEYPMITSISPVKDEKTLDLIIKHEVGHNWFKEALASNERSFPWMDEGMNTFYDNRYMRTKYQDTLSNVWWRKKFPAVPETLFIDVLAKQKIDQPLNTSSDKFSLLNYQFMAYVKAGIWMHWLEEYLSEPVFDTAMKKYFTEWQFRHPGPLDFKRSIEQSSGRNIDSLFSLLGKKGPVTNQLSRRKFKPSFLFSAKNYDKFIYFNFLPLAGYNKYDGFMLGSAFHNFNLPANRFQFFAAPLYGIASKRLNGLALVKYNFYTSSHLKISAGMMLERFSMLAGTDSNGIQIYGRFDKTVPSIRIDFPDSDPLSKKRKSLEWKTFLVGERGFQYLLRSSDSLYYPVQEKRSYRYLNQVTFTISNERILYPYDVRFQLQQGADFYRASATGLYNFNYSVRGEMKVRVFAAKFGYLGGKDSRKTFNTSVYQPKLTAVRGNEDYTFSNYFLGRNEQAGLFSQQIMVRDGGLKIRTDLFQGLQGRSDNWIASLNLSSSIPENLFPVKIPLRIFLDVGTYAESWKKEAPTSRLLYVGGLQLSLFRQLVNIYAPIIYSHEFRDNLKTVPEENSFFKRISFSIDAHLFTLKKITGNNVPF